LSLLRKMKNGFRDDKNIIEEFYFFL